MARRATLTWPRNMPKLPSHIYLKYLKLGKE